VEDKQAALEKEAKEKTMREQTALEQGEHGTGATAENQKGVASRKKRRSVAPVPGSCHHVIAKW
jgi:hypothetical protein